MSNLDFAMSVLSNEKNCENCYHYHSRHCALYSCDCANDVAHHTSAPKWWMSYEEGEAIDKELGL